MKIAKVVSLLLLTLGCFSLQSLDAEDRLNVVATNTLIADWVNAVGGEKVQLVTLVGPDSDMHSFEPSPKDVQQVAKAQLIFENGLGLEYWLNGLYKASNSKAVRVALAEELTLLPYEECGHGCHHGDHVMEKDPHVWLDVGNVIFMVKKIEKELAKYDPVDAAYYQLRADNYIKQLQSLDEWIVARIQEISTSERQLITNHNNLRYFANRYGLSVLGSVLQSGTTEGADPSAGGFAKLIQRIKQHKVKAIFGENIHSKKLVEQLSREAGLGTPLILYTEALSPTSGPASSYVELMRYNVNALVKGLGQ